MIDLYFAEFHIELIEAEGGKLVTVDCAMMRELITRLRQAEKDAARYRSAVSILGEASEMLQLLSLSASNVSERNMERVDAVVYEIDLELLKCNK